MKASTAVCGFALTLLALLLGARFAEAGIATVQATVGHPPNSAGMGTDLYAVDGQVCVARAKPSTGWWVPVQLAATNTTYTGTQYTTLADPYGTVPYTRIVTLNPDNTVYQIGGFTQANDLGTIYVPTDGTLFTQSTIWPGGCLDSIKVTY